jgi:hypothetical protein
MSGNCKMGIAGNMHTTKSQCEATVHKHFRIMEEACHGGSLCAEHSCEGHSRALHQGIDPSPYFASLFVTELECFVHVASAPNSYTSARGTRVRLLTKPIMYNRALVLPPHLHLHWGPNQNALCMLPVS